MQQSHSSRSVIVTGGATGIGFSTAETLLRDSQYRVALVGRNASELEQAAKNLGAPDRVTLHECDLRQPSQIHATVEKIANVHRNLWGLVNNAGVYPFGGLATTSLENWNETLQINLTAAFLLIQSVAPILAKNGGGRILNVSSTAGMLPNHFALAYSVSKSALIQLTKTLAKELGKDGITVNCVCPGIVRSPMHAVYHHSGTALEEFYAKRGAAYPMGRVGEPKDVAHAIRFFLGEETEWLTGDVMVIDGGRLLT